MKETMSINLKDLFTLIKKKIWMIALVGLVFGLVTAGVNQFLLKPVYKATTTIITNKEIDEEMAQMSTSDDFNFSQKMAVTYSNIITSRVVLDQVIKDLNLKIAYEDLENLVDVETVDDTQIIEINVT